MRPQAQSEKASQEKDQEVQEEDDDETTFETYEREKFPKDFFSLWCTL